MLPRDPGGLLSKECGEGGGAWPAWSPLSLLSFTWRMLFPTQPCSSDKSTKVWAAFGQQELEKCNGMTCSLEFLKSKGETWQEEAVSWAEELGCPTQPIWEKQAGGS